MEELKKNIKNKKKVEEILKKIDINEMVQMRNADLEYSPYVYGCLTYDIEIIKTFEKRGYKTIYNEEENNIIDDILIYVKSENIKIDEDELLKVIEYLMSKKELKNVVRFEINEGRRNSYSIKFVYKLVKLVNKYKYEKKYLIMNIHQNDSILNNLKNEEKESKELIREMYKTYKKIDKDMTMSYINNLRFFEFVIMKDVDILETFMKLEKSKENMEAYIYNIKHMNQKNEINLKEDNMFKLLTNIILKSKLKEFV